MEEFRLDGLTVKEHLLILAEEGNRKFTEGLHPGVHSSAPAAKDRWRADNRAISVTGFRDRLDQLSQK